MSCRHEWSLRTDMIGDCGVINGTMTYEYAVCVLCGDESSELEDINEAQRNDDDFARDDRDPYENDNGDYDDSY